MTPRQPVGSAVTIKAHFAPMVMFQCMARPVGGHTASCWVPLDTKKQYTVPTCIVSYVRWCLASLLFLPLAWKLSNVQEDFMSFY